MTAVIEVKKLKRAFGGVVAVNNISFDVNTGEIVGFIGPNGSGKSTLFNLLTGVLKPDSGQVRLFGKNVSDPPSPSFRPAL